MTVLNITQYPVLTDDLFSKLGFTQGDISYYFYLNGKKQILKATSEDGATARTTLVQLTDPSGEWHPDKDDLYIRVCGNIQSPGFLFGNGKTGAGIISDSSESVLGLGIQWTDKESNIRGSAHITEITSNQKTGFSFAKDLHFPPGMLRGTLCIRIILYIIHSEQQKGSYYRYATETGTVLGELDDLKIVIEGSGSVFPVIETNDPNGPLWWVATDFIDPKSDKFDDDHLQLYLNQAHRDFSDLHLREPDIRSPLMQDILASTFFTLIMQVSMMEGGTESIRRGDSAEPGSISKILFYMCSTYDWLPYLEDPSALNKAIHMTVEKWV